jgi:hypothetical protein
MTFYFSPSLRIIATAFLLGYGVPHRAVAQTGTTVPPARTYYLDSEDKRLGVKERWAEDANGEKNGAYLRYNAQGAVVESSTFVHGAQTGAGRSYEYFTAGTRFSLTGKSSGNYRDGRRVGTWTTTDSKGALYKMDVYQDGNLLTSTYYNQGRPVAIRHDAPVAASAATTAGTSPGSFYYYLPAEKEQFLAMKFSLPERPERLTGAELLKPEYREYLTRGVLLAKLVHECGSARQIELLLKQIKSMGGNPLKSVMQESVWDCRGGACVSDYESLNSDQVVGELLYYGMVGTDTEDNVKMLLWNNRGVMGKQQAAIQDHFAACARANHDPHADAFRYPLRFWLYEKFAQGDPLRWMNTVTKSDPARDPQMFPSLYGN